MLPATSLSSARTFVWDVTKVGSLTKTVFKISFQRHWNWREVAPSDIKIGVIGVKEGADKGSAPTMMR